MGNLQFSASEPAGENALPVAEAARRLTDRQRLAVLLEGAATLSLAHQAGRRLVGGWSRAKVDPSGRLRGLELVPGPATRLPQDLLRLLAARLFGGSAIAGRGQSRRVVRRAMDIWNQGLVPIDANRAVEILLDLAPFLWTAAFAGARAALVARVVHEQEEVLLAGPVAWRRRCRERASDFSEMVDLLRSRRVIDLWRGPSKGDVFELAEEDLRRGRFERALGAIRSREDVPALRIRLLCQYGLGDFRAARRTLGYLVRGDLDASTTVAAAEVAVRVMMGLGQPEGARDWVARALASGRSAPPVLRARSRLLPAVAAWDQGRWQEMAEPLEKAQRLRDDPSEGWRWLRVAALAERFSRRSADYLEEALGTARRCLSTFDAAGLWNDLGVARGGTGDLAGAERAFLHAVRLYRQCDGPRATTLGLLNLSEIRLRRGRLGGVAEVVERSLGENRRSGNLRGLAYDRSLEARLELARGRPLAALQSCEEGCRQLEQAGLEGHAGTLHLLGARALGWLDRPDEAREALVRVSAGTFDEIEPEERPAVWALAGDREAALLAVDEDETGGRLWTFLLTGQAVPREEWRVFEEVEPFRAARWVFDLEILFPHQVPTRWRRQALRVLRRGGAGMLADRIERREAGPWKALEEFLQGGGTAWSEMFEAMGYPEARVVWTGGSDLQVLVDGEGGPVGQTAPHEGGEIGLWAKSQDAVLEALFALLRDRVTLTASAPSAAARSRGAGHVSAENNGEILGSSHALRQALARLDRLAPEPLPILLRGESGTGKELFARRVHRLSPRRGGPFVAINCAALSGSLLLSDLFGHVRGAFTGADRDRSGVFEAARGGTVLLDEIGDLPAEAQGMLLRVLQEGEVRRVGESLSRAVDVRVVAASHRDLAELAEAGDFRSDLYYRLKGALIVLPPLAARGEDVLVLARAILDRRGGGTLSAEAKKRLRGYSWPGNVRELENTLQTAAALAGAGVIEPEHLELPEAPRGPISDYHREIEALRRKIVSEALERSAGNQSAAARELGVTRQAMSYLVKKLKLR
ncbi:MAG: sigma 54-interacting transcriptional regulator [Acidobacteriota bacterium]